MARSEIRQQNEQVTNRSGLLRKAQLLALAGVALAFTGASCEKTSAKPGADPNDVVAAMDAAKGNTMVVKPEGPVDTQPLAGVDVSKLDAKKQERFYGLIATLASPCGKAHSLRTSVASDTACKRAPFAARYVAELLADEASDADVKTEYEAKYGNAKIHKIDVAGAPAHGPVDAPVKLVEFFDYGCPACQAFNPVLQETLKANGSNVVVFYKMFPLQAHPDSFGAAQAALAAQAQGKFEEMHAVLFENQHKHKLADLEGYAQKLGLDMTKFKADFAAVKPRIEADLKQGDEAGVDSTPSLYFNGRKYDGPMHPRYLGLWIEEEVAVNR